MTDRFDDAWRVGYLEEMVIMAVEKDPAHPIAEAYARYRQLVIERGMDLSDD